MYLRRLAVTDFRSWASVDVALGPGVTVLVGPNGVGKTNLVEAVGYLATFSSHRVATDAPLVRRGADRAVVRGLAVRTGRELSVEVEITPGKANRARVNRAVLPRARDALGIVRSVLFAPEDLALVRGDPGERRRFLDELLVSRWPRFAGVRADYDRVLRQRAALLKTARTAGPRGRSGELSTLDVWDGHLARHGAALLAGRLRLVADLAAPVRDAYAEVAPESVPVELRYRCSAPELVPPDATGLSGWLTGERDRGAVRPRGELAAQPRAGLEAELEAGLLAELARVRGQELERAVCLVGPHRDDLELRLGDGPAKGYASHGESWSLALALRLGSFELLRRDPGEGGDSSDPILILDDVFAELDARRRRALAELAVRAEQVLVTAAVPDDVPEKLRGTWFTVESGQVTGPSS